MSAGNSEVLVFFLFFPNNVHFLSFFMVAWEKKKQKNVFFMEYGMYIRPKLTFVSFFLFFCIFP